LTLSNFPSSSSGAFQKWTPSFPSSPIRSRRQSPRLPCFLAPPDYKNGAPRDSALIPSHR
jgi:hypothetical protein